MKINYIIYGIPLPTAHNTGFPTPEDDELVIAAISGLINKFLSKFKKSTLKEDNQSQESTDKEFHV